KLNQTLTATAQALDGLGDKFGQSIVNGNDILSDLNPRMPQIRRDIAGLADLGEVYANAGPDLFDGLTNAVTTARTLNEQRGNLDQALVAAVSFGGAGVPSAEATGAAASRAVAASAVATARRRVVAVMSSRPDPVERVGPGELVVVDVPG
ncbi:MCE family protein, partial [Streptomyces sp. DSM 44915]